MRRGLGSWPQWAMAASVTLMLSACTESSTRAGGGTAAPVGSGVVARVGNEDISLQTVQRIASAQGVSAKAALDMAIEDVLLAARAREELPPYVALSQLRRVALARPLLDAIGAESRARGLPTDEEVRAAIERRWWVLDRPTLARTTHAVIQFEPEQEDAARALAAAVAQAVDGTSDPKEFKRKVAEVPAGDLKLKTEDLTPVAADGRSVDPRHPPPPGSRTGKLDADFAAAALALTEVGQISPIIRTQFGFHVILLTEIIAAHQPAFEEHRQQLAEEIYADRARTALTALLEPLRVAEPATFTEQAPALTGLIRVEQ